MYPLDEIKSFLAAAKPGLQEKYPISDLGIFGSYARGDADESSDIDKLVDFNGAIVIRYFDLIDDIFLLFKIKVDVILKRGIKPNYLPFVNDDLQYV